MFFSNANKVEEKKEHEGQEENYCIPALLYFGKRVG